MTLSRDVPLESRTGLKGLVTRLEFVCFGLNLVHSL